MLVLKIEKEFYEFIYNSKIIMKFNVVLVIINYRGRYK